MKNFFYSFVYIPCWMRCVGVRGWKGRERWGKVTALMGCPPPLKVWVILLLVFFPSLSLAPS